MKPGAWQVIIVNYRTAALAVRALRSARSSAPDAEITIVDNGSGDNSTDILRGVPGATLVTLPSNKGYAAALNAGARGGATEYLLLLNADVQLGADCVRRLQQRFEALPGLGLVAPRLVSPDATIQPSCRLFPTHRALLLSRGSPVGWLRSTSNRSYRVPEPSAFTLTDVVAGACLAVRRQVWQDLDGMDEGFFLYAEDTDLCLRAKQAGWLAGYDPAIVVQHEWGASTRQARRRSNHLHAQSLSRYFHKHYPQRPVSNALVSCVLRIHASVRR